MIVWFFSFISIIRVIFLIPNYYKSYWRTFCSNSSANIAQKIGHLL